MIPEEKEDTFLSEMLVDTMECPNQRFVDGPKKEELNGSLPLLEEDSSSCQAKTKQKTKRSFSTQECQVPNNETTLNDNKNTLTKNVLSNSKSIAKHTIMISHPDSISNEEALLPFWKESKKETYTRLSWLQKIDWLGLDTNSSNGYVSNTEQKSWFWNTTITHLPKNSEKTCYPSFRFIVVNGMDKEGTNKKSKKAKTQKIPPQKVIKKSKKMKKKQNKSETLDNDDDSSIVKCFKLKIYPTMEQKIMLNQWAGSSRFTYNKVLHTLNNPKNTMKDWMRLRNRFVTSKTRKGTTNTFFSDKAWLLKTPKSIRLESVKEVCKNRKSCFKNIENGNIDSFNIRFKTKRREKQNGWTIGLEKNNVVRKENNLFIFPNILGEIRYASTKQLRKLIPNSKPECDPKIQKDRYGDYYLILSRKLKVKKDNRNEYDSVVSVDRGVKIFAACYDPKGTACLYGKDVDKVLLDMLEELDELISLRDKITDNVNYRRRIDLRIRRKRRRIMNYKKELHNQFNNYLTKNYSLILCPKLDTQKLTLKERRTLKTKTVRAMLNLGHCSAHDKLIEKCKERNVTMLSPSEAYTTKTCPCCGKQKACTNERIRICYSCNYRAERDLNGALNILLRSIA